ncbi:hypothetical protein [Actinoplanes sp. NPDC049118]|uniref:hypothetical protein n=1 Tax=Actinoplanes sp. NPDC049118 TaxID=3155769 RepID=UPI0033D79FB5
MSGSVRPVCVPQIHLELGEGEVGEAWAETPALTEIDTLRVEFDGGAEDSLGNRIPTLGDDGGGVTQEPARNAWHRWFSSAHDGDDVGLDLLPFDDEDWHPSAADPEPEPARPVPSGRKARRTGKPGSRRKRIVLVGIMSLAVLNLGASLSGPAGAPRRSTAPGGVAADRPGTPQNQAHIDGLRFFPLPARSSLGAPTTGTGPVARR